MFLMHFFHIRFHLFKKLAKLVPELILMEYIIFIQLDDIFLTFQIIWNSGYDTYFEIN